MILVLPVVFETEKLQMEQQQQLQQRQVRQEGQALSPGLAEFAVSSCWESLGRKVQSVVHCGLAHPTTLSGWMFYLDNPTDSQCQDGSNLWQAQPGFHQLKQCREGLNQGLWLGTDLGCCSRHGTGAAKYHQ